MSGLKKDHASMKISGIQIVSFFAVILCNSIQVFSMEKQLNAQQLGTEMSRLLPDLTLVPSYTVSSVPSTVLVNDLKKQQEYVHALSFHDPITALQEVAKPTMLENHEQLIAGKWVKAGGKQRFLLADFALAVKQLEEFGNVAQTERVFRDVEHTISPYLSWQEPILYSVRCARQLLSHQPEKLFENLLLLENKAKTFSCWQPMANLLGSKLIEVGYLPAHKRLADSGDTTAQVKVIQAVASDALTKKDLGVELVQLLPYAENLVQQPNYQEVVSSLVTYGAALHAYQAQRNDNASSLLITLLQEKPKDALVPELYQLSRELLQVLADIGDIRSNCFLAKELISSSNKHKKTEGLVKAERLVQSCMAQKNQSVERKLQVFGLLDCLQDLAVSNHPVVCAFFTEWELYKTLGTKLDAAAEKAAYKKIKTHARSGLSLKGAHAGNLQQIDIFAQAVLQYYNNDPKAANQLIDFITMTNQGFHVNAQMRVRAEELLEQLVTCGQLDACCYKVQRLLHAEKEVVSDTTFAYCIKTAELYLAQRMPSRSDESCFRLGIALPECIAKATDAQAKLVDQANLLMSKLRFLELHDGCVETGLTLEAHQPLKDLFVVVSSAYKAGVQDAKPFMQAIAAYSLALNHLSQKRTPEAVEQLLKLVDIEISAPYKKICSNFARYQLDRLAQAGNAQASAWHVAQLFTSEQEADICNALSVCERLVTGLLGKHTSEDAWQKALEPFKKFKVLKSFEQNMCKDVWKNLQYNAAYILSKWYLLQATVPYHFMEDAIAQDELMVLEKALEYAKKAYTLGDADVKKDCADLMGAIYLVFGQTCIQKNEYERAGEMLAHGSRLNHPASMRACAMLALEQPSVESRMMHETLFKAQISMIERAYQLGDKQAGAILAQHYYDGQMSPFACGNYLEKNLNRALILAQEIGALFPQTARILGFLAFYKATKDPKAQEKKVDLTQAVELLISSAEGGQVQAYGHLEEVLLSTMITDKVAQRVHLFIVEKADLHIPEALCALGGIFIASSGSECLGNAVRCYQEAAHYSDGRLGHFELAHFYLNYIVDGKCDIFNAAHHCIEMTKAGVKIGCAPIEQSKLTAQIIHRLVTFEGTQDQIAQAKAMHAEILVQLARAGVQVVADGQKGTPTGREDATQFASEMEEVQKKEEATRAQMHQLAKEGDASAQCSLSHYYLEKACAVFQAAQVPVGSSQDFITALEYGMQAFRNDSDNVAYKNQLIAAHREWFRYYKEIIIPHLAHDQTQYTAGLVAIEKTVAALNQSGLHADEATGVRDQALDCIRDLAAHGAVRALDLLLANELTSQDATRQQAALKAIFRGCFALSQIDESDWQKSGISKILEPHSTDLEKLATSGNGYASFIMGCLTSKKATAQRTPQERMQLIDSGYAYYTQAIQQGCQEAGTVAVVTKLTRDKKLMAEECTALIATLEDYTLRHPIDSYPDLEAVHCVIRMYREGITFPCGFRVGKNNARAYELALRWKDISSTSLMNVCFIAQEARDYPKFFEHAFELYQEGAFTLNDMVQFAVQLKLFPPYFREYLFEEAKRGNAYALRSLSVLLQQSNEMFAFITLCEALYQEGHPHACTELALGYVDPLFEGSNIETALKYASEHIAKIKGSKEALADFINSMFKRLIFTVSFAAATTDESPLKKQACDAIITLEQQVKEMCGTKFMSAELKGAQVILLCATHAAHFVKIVDAFADLLALYRKHTPVQFEETLKCCALMIVRAYKGIMAYDGKDKAVLTKIATAQMVRLNDLINKLDPNSKALLQSIVRKK